MAEPLDLNDQGEHPPRTPLQKFGLVCGIAAMTALAAFWMWAFVFADEIKHPDDMEDPVFSEAAQAICDARQTTIRSLPFPNAVESPQERAGLIDLGTAELTAMIDELQALPRPTDPANAALVSRWLSDYEIYLNDRVVYSGILRGGDDPPFLVSGNADGNRVTDLLTTFAEVNRMESCGPSGDV